MQLPKQAGIAIKEWGKEFCADASIAAGLAEKMSAALLPAEKDEGGHAQLKDWLTAQIKESGRSNNLNVTAFWESLGNSSQGVLTYILANASLSATKDLPADADPTTAIPMHIMRCISSFVREKHTSIEEKYAELKNAGKKPEDEPSYQKLFIPLSQQMQEMIELRSKEKVLPAFLNPLITTVFEKQLPKLMAEYHEYLLPLAEMHDTMAKAQDQKSYAQRLQDLLPGDETRTLINNVCQILTEKISGAIDKAVAEKIGVAVGAAPIESPVHQKFLQIMQIKEVYQRDAIKSLLLQAIVHYLEGVQAEGVKIEEASFTAIATKLASTLQNRLVEDAPKIKLAGAIQDPEKCKEALREGFEPLARDLLNLIRAPGAVNKEGVPVAIPFGPLLQKMSVKLETKILPDVLAEMYLDTTSWQQQAKSIASKLKRAQAAPISQACRVFAKWISEYLPPFLSRDSSEVAKQIFDGITQYLKSTGKQNEISVLDYLMKNGDAIQKMLAGTLTTSFKKVSDNKDTALVTAMKPLTQDFFESGPAKNLQRSHTKDR